MIKNGEIADALDIEKIIVSNLQSINQNTILSANATVTDKSYTYASSDTFSDSNGYNNTIDTGNTTASFVGNRYEALDVEIEETLTLGVNVGEETQTAKFGSKLTVNRKCIITTASKQNNDTSTRWYLGTTNGGSEISSGTFPANINQILEIGTYYLTVDNQGSNYLRSRETSPSFPYTGTNITVSSNNDGSTTNQWVWQTIKSKEITGVTNSQVQTNSKTFNSNVKSILVNANKVLNGDSTITVDVSSDGGSTWDVTEQALDTIIELDGDDNDIVIKFNLNVDGNTPELYGYSYQVFT